MENRMPDIITTFLLNLEPGDVSPIVMREPHTTPGSLFGTSIQMWEAEEAILRIRKMVQAAGGLPTL